MMRDSKSSEKKPIEEVQAPRPRKYKLERIGRKSPKCKRAEEALLSERNRLTSILEAMADGVYIANQEYDIEYVNPVLEKDFGSWEGRKCYEYFHDRKKSCPWCKSKDVFAGKTVRWEWYSNKNRKTYDLIDTPLKNPDGSLSKLEIFRDITERKKVEEQLEQSREFLANTINALDDTFFVKDEEHRWAALNDAACEAIGRPREELIGKSDYDCFPKEQADKFWEKDNLVFETGETNVSEEEVTWRGKVHTISTKKSLFTDFMTGKRFIVGTARDITEQKRAVNAVWENERFLHNIFNAIQDGVSVLDLDLNIVRVNPWMEEMYADKMSLVGKKCYTVYQKRKSVCPRCPSVRAIETGQSQTEIVPYPSLDKATGWLELSAFPLKDTSGKVTGVIEHVKDMTERKKAEESLQESEQKYRALIEQSLHGIVILQDYKIVFANKAACEIPGLTMEELLGLTLEDMMAFIPPENRSTIRERLKDRFAGGDVPQNYELRLIRKNGEEAWLNLFFSPIEYQGRFAIQLAFYDITENKRMEETLRVSEASYKELADSITDIFFAMDKNLRYTYWNKASEKLTGIRAEHAIGKSIFDIFPDTEATRKAAGVYQEVFKTQQPQSFMNDYQLHGKDFSFEINAYPSGQGLSVFATDITDRLQAEKQLKQSQEFLANITNALDDPVFVKDEKHRWAVLNDAACEVMGRSREELIGKTDYDLFSKEQADVFWERDNYVLETGKTDVNEEEITWHGKLHTISTKKSVYTDSLTGKKFIAGTIRDITDRKKAEETLTESEEKFRNLAEQSPNMIFINKRGKVVYANKKCEDVMGYKREEFYHPDFDFMDLIAPEFRQLIKTNFGRHMKGEEIEPYEYGLITKNGEKLDAIITTKLMKYEGEDSILGTITDITGRKKTQQKIARLAKFPSEDPNPVLRISKDYTILYANDASSIVLETWERKVGERLPKACCERVEEVFSSGTASTFEFHCHNGQIFEVKLVPIMESGYANAYGLDITERKKAEEALKDSETKYRSLVTNIPDVVWTSDEKGRTIFISANIESIYGYSPEEIYREGDRIWFGRIHPDDLEKVKDSFKAVFEKGKQLDLEYRIRRKDGEWIWIRDRSIGAYEKNGIKYADGVFSDITERKQTQEALRESEGKAWALLNATTDAVLLIDKEGLIIEVNDKMSERLGQIREDLIGTIIYDYLPPEITQQRKLKGFEVARTRQPIRFEDQREGRWLENNVYPIFDPHGETERFAIYSTDITEHKQAEEALQESESRFRELVENISEVFWMENVEGTELLYVSPTYEQIWGRSCQNFYDNPRVRIEAIHPDDRRRVVDAFNKFRETGAYSEEFRILRPDGSMRWIWDRGVLIHDESGQIHRVAGIAEDITQRKQAEEKFRDYQEQLKSLASQLTLAEEWERRRIATELHDEISQSLFISKMKLEALHKSELDKKFNDTLDEINNSLGRILAAMRSLTFDLSSPILYEFGFEEAVAEWLNERVEKKYGIATEFEDDGLHKSLDDDIRVLLFRNVRELLINVVKHAHASKVKVSIGKVGGRIRVSVEDDGLGFEPAKVKSMITNKEAFGLFSIRERLEHFGGNLNIDSAPGCGCRVTITSPLKREDVNKDKQK